MYWYKGEPLRDRRVLVQGEPLHDHSELVQGEPLHDHSVLVFQTLRLLNWGFLKPVSVCT